MADQLVALLRAGHHLGHIEKEEDLLHSILNDAVSVLEAQRGAIVLAEGPENKLKLKAIASGKNEPRAIAAGRGDAGGRFQFSQSLANRCVSRGESILCHSVEEDPELAMAKSIAEGRDGVRPVCSAAHAAQTPGHSSSRPQPVAKAVHHGRSALGRRSGGQRLVRH